MRSGRLIVHTGTMFGGKSKALVAIVRNQRIKTQQFIPQQDTRDRRHAIVTHDGEAFDALRILRSEEIFTNLEEDTEVVVVDEIHMLDAGTPAALRQLVDRYGVDVYAAGLATDFLGKPFKIMMRTMAYANEVHFHASYCRKCGAEAVYNQRIVDDPRRIVPGGDGVYEPRCRICFELGGRDSERTDT